MNKHNLLIAVSKVEDGTMKVTGEPDPGAVYDNRRRFLAQSGVTPEQTVLVPMTYETDDFCRYQEVSEADGGHAMESAPRFIADGALTNQPGVALFMPLADCVGAVLHDRKERRLMLSHLGRHNLEQLGGVATVEYMKSFGSDPADIEVYLSPAAGGENYPLYKLAMKSLHQVACEQLKSAGIPEENIEVSPDDTTTNKSYFSHSQYLKGNRPSNGRHAIVAMMRE